MERLVQTAGITKHIGVPRKRSEDPQFLMGRARYVDDVAVAGTLDGAFLRSTRAHSGCVHILTGEEYSVKGDAVHLDIRRAQTFLRTCNGHPDQSAKLPRGVCHGR